MSAKVRWNRDAWWVITHHDGKRKKKRVGPTKADKRRAEAIAEKVNASIALGQYRPAVREKRPLPCDQHLRNWIETYGPTMKATSETSARGLISNHLIPFFQSKDLREITEADLLQFAKERVEAGLSPKTIKNALSVLRRVFNLAHREGLVSRNPASGIGDLMRRVDQRSATEVQQVQAWTRPEVDDLLALARGHEPLLYPGLLFLFSTGARRGEMLGLKWEDVDFDRREIVIRRSITARQVTTPKSGRSRILAMPEGLAINLFDLLTDRRRQALARGWPAVPEWVFCSTTGTAPEERNFERLWYRLRRRAQKQGILPLKLHAARHTWATFALEAGRNVRWVADRLGHADPALTLRTYAHAMRAEDRDVSFAEFGDPKRPYAAPLHDDQSEGERKYLENGGPSGTRTLDPRVKSPVTRTKTA